MTLPATTLRTTGFRTRIRTLTPDHFRQRSNLGLEYKSEKPALAERPTRVRATLTPFVPSPSVASGRKYSPEPQTGPRSHHIGGRSTRMIKPEEYDRNNISRNRGRSSRATHRSSNPCRKNIYPRPQRSAVGESPNARPLQRQ